MSRPTPLLDLFKRGEVARDVRLLAAQGGLETPAIEQLGILITLLEDTDPEIRTAADQTLNRIPVASLQVFLGRSDVPVSLREFFADRNVFPAETPAIRPPEDEEPIVAAAADALDAELNAAVEAEASEAAAPAAGAGQKAAAEKDASRDSASQMIAKMSFTQRLKAASKGTKEMRAILIRDPNKMIAAAVLSSPKLSDSEVANIAKMTSVSDEVLRIIGQNRAWTKNYNVILGLVKNPKAPLAMTMNMMQRLNDRDVQQLSVDRNVPEPLRVAARKKIVAGASGRG